MRQLTPLLLGMSATAGLIGLVTWSVQAIGQLEQQRSQQHILETLLEESGSDQQPVHSSADSSTESSKDKGATTNSVLHPSPGAKPLGAPGNPMVRVALLSQSPPRSVDLSGQAECRFSNGKVIQK